MSRNIKTPNWSGVKVARSSALTDSAGHVKKGIKVIGSVSRNHASTITKYRKSKDGKVYQDYIDTTHRLPKEKQALICSYLDNPDTKDTDHIALYDYDTKNSVWVNAKNGISQLVDKTTGEVLRTVDHNKKGK